MATQQEHWETVKALFEAALDQEPASRSSFLMEHCFDERLRSEVERLLGEHQEAGTFLSTPAVRDLAFDAKASVPIRGLAEGPILAGRFRILSFIAAGGMGEVYKAVDTRLGRQVAIKLVSEALSQRFEREARTIASLNHPWDGPSIIPFSNYSGRQPVRVGQYAGMSWTGAYDMAGNVKEWCMNEDAIHQRYVMGGAWNEPTYEFNQPDARSPFERAANFGFRTARYAVTQEFAKAGEPLKSQTRDYSREVPVSDEVFAAYKSLFAYDKTPLRSVVESTEVTEHWTKQRITFDAAYNHERMAAYLFLPKKASPPFQTVVYFPGVDAVFTRSSTTQLRTDLYDYVIKSGRAVLFPIYQSTYERGDGLKNTRPNMTTVYRDHVIEWSQDLGRSIDYLETRPDIDGGKLAYMGVSWGAALGAVFPAVDDRFKAVLLDSPGLYPAPCLPQVDQLNFAPRVKAPVLMLNGRYDYYYPPPTSQEPMFRLLGTPKEQKRRVVYDTGHDTPRTGVVKETLNWLDKYLGPVK